MQFNLPPDLEVLVQRRLASGRFASTEEVFRCALETLDAEESWTSEECRLLDEKIDRSREKSAAGLVFGPDESRRKLEEMRRIHLAGLSQ